VDDELGEFRRALVRVTTVPEEEFGQVGELVDGEIGSEGGLTAFFADDTDACSGGGQSALSMRGERSEHRRKGRTDISSLNHRNIISSISNAANPLLRLLADQTSDIGFLSGRAPAGDDGSELGRELDELVAEMVDAELEKRKGESQECREKGNEGEERRTWRDSPSITRQQSSLVARKSSSSRASAGDLTVRTRRKAVSNGLGKP
jgi:hypothetical protein